MSELDLAPATVDRLIEHARRAREHAHAPYSRFRVGAAVLAEDGRVFVGCNVENASFGLTVCAERNAVAAAVVAGARPVAVAVLTDRDHVLPCGACRQVLAEFGDLTVVVAAADGSDPRASAIGTLLPAVFRFAVPEG